MHPTRHGKPVIITANVVIGACAAAVRQWRRCKTIRREAEPLVCLGELTARVRRCGFHAELLTAAGPEAS